MTWTIEYHEPGSPVLRRINRIESRERALAQLWTLRRTAPVFIYTLEVVP